MEVVVVVVVVGGGVGVVIVVVVVVVGIHYESTINQRQQVGFILCFC